MSLVNHYKNYRSFISELREDGQDNEKEQWKELFQNSLLEYDEKYTYNNIDWDAVEYIYNQNLKPADAAKSYFENGLGESVEDQKTSNLLQRLREKRLEQNLISEKGPISKEGALKFVFKLPKEGKFTAEFLDGSKATLNVDSKDESSGAYAFVGKSNGSIFKTWNEKPSKDAAHDVLQRVKSYK